MIQGERVQLRPPERSDLPNFVKWLNDSDVQAGLSLYLPLSMSEEEAWFTHMLERPADEHPLVIEVRMGNTWIPIGNCSFFGFDWRVHLAEVGIFIGEKMYWNQGFGTEVMRLLLKHGFNTLNLNRIFLRVFSTNLRAIRSYEKAGFVHEGRLRQAMYKQGQYLDVVMMSVLRSEWQG